MHRKAGRGSVQIDCACYRLQLSEEEKQHLERFFTHEGESRRLEYLNSRRKSKKTYEYEVKWYGVRDSKNTWITREQCVFTPPSYLPHCPASN